jgi:Gas vesicle synthesis protein GvpL/GvpF
MSAVTESDETTGRNQTTGIYVYGIVPADVEVDSEARGVGDDSAQVTVARHDDIAALVSEINLDRPLGRPEDLLAHERLLDATAAEVPVLPARFGAVLTDRDAVVNELLAPHHDEFLAALEELEGKAQYVVKGRYVEEAVLSEIVSDYPEIARLREEIRDKPEEVTRNERIKVGELINQAVEANRQLDSRKVADALTPHSVAVTIRDPTHELDAANVAILAETARDSEIVNALEELARDWEGRVNVRLLGPLAAYDFVATPKPGE